MTIRQKTIILIKLARRETEAAKATVTARVTAAVSRQMAEMRIRLARTGVAMAAGILKRRARLAAMMIRLGKGGIRQKLLAASLGLKLATAAAAAVQTCPRLPSQSKGYPIRKMVALALPLEIPEWTFARCR